MKKDYFKDSESVIDTILSDWQTTIKKNEDETLLIKLNQLEKSFHEFRVELLKRRYKLS